MFFLSCLHNIHDWTPRKSSPVAWLLVHARSYPIPKGLKPYKGIVTYANLFRHLIVQR